MRNGVIKRDSFLEVGAFSTVSQLQMHHKIILDQETTFRIVYV